MGSFRMEAGETLADLLAEYDAVAKRTDDLVSSLPDLDQSRPLPEAPWFEPGASWTLRRVLMHIIAETRSTPATPTSSARPSTVRRPWLTRAGPPDCSGVPWCRTTQPSLPSRRL